MRQDAFQATLEEDGGGYPTTIATNESRIIFRGNLYICKVFIVVNKGEGGKQVVRHFVPRDYTLKKVVIDHHKNFGLDRTEMMYSVMPWKAPREHVVFAYVYPENTFSMAINDLGFGCDRLFHLKVTNDVAEVAIEGNDIACVINYDIYRQDELREKKEGMVLDFKQMRKSKKTKPGKSRRAVDELSKITDDMKSY